MTQTYRAKVGDNYLCFEHGGFHFGQWEFCNLYIDFQKLNDDLLAYCRQESKDDDEIFVALSHEPEAIPCSVTESYQTMHDDQRAIICRVTESSLDDTDLNAKFRELAPEKKKPKTARKK